MLQANPTSFDALYHDFRWNIPTRFNIAEACVTRYANATPDAPALIIDHGANEAADILSWGDLEVRVQKIAAVLVSHGVSRGDRVAIQLPQGWEAVATHLATYRLGALATPFATQFGPQAIAYRINKARPKVFVATPDAVARWQRSDTAHTSTPETLVVSDNAEQSSFHRAFDAALPSDIAVETTPNDPAMLLFTSGTTGQPKGVVHGHRVLLGHLPGIQLAQEMMPQLGDVFWTPSDWAWAGGLLNALLPALYFGVPVVAANAPRFSAEWALDVMARNKVTNVFVPPTAIRIIANHQGVVPQLSVRAVGAAGEQLGAQTHAAASAIFNAPINEFYGQTECNAIIGSSHKLGVNDPASMGRAIPGHQVKVSDEHGEINDHGHGEIVIKADTPVAMLEYFEDPTATADKISNGWIRTGDVATLRRDGSFEFQSRNDDVITSAGYRIGPSEIEECLRAHPNVAEAAVVGIPDKERTETIAAFVTIKDKTDELNLPDTLKVWVKNRLSAHLYPRRVEIVDAIPTTESGKIIRRAFRKRA